MTIAAADVINSFNNQIRNPANGGISWGTNSYPAYSDPGWFGGDTNGVPGGENLVAAHIGAPGTIVASTLVNALYNYTYIYGRIKYARILVYMNGVGYVQDGTAVAHLQPWYNVGVPGAGSGAQVAGGYPSLGNVQAHLNNLWYNYVNYARNHTTTFSVTICHSSCHSNCHGSRSRR